MERRHGPADSSASGNLHETGPRSHVGTAYRHSPATTCARGDTSSVGPGRAARPSPPRREHRVGGEPRRNTRGPSKAIRHSSGPGLESGSRRSSTRGQSPASALLSGTAYAFGDSPTTSCAARRSASTMLSSLATPFHAMSKAVPWSTEVRTIGRPRVTVTLRSNPWVLIGMCP